MVPSKTREDFDPTLSRTWHTSTGDFRAAPRNYVPRLPPLRSVRSSVRSPLSSLLVVSTRRSVPPPPRRRHRCPVRTVHTVREVPSVVRRVSLKRHVPSGRSADLVLSTGCLSADHRGVLQVTLPRLLYEYVAVLVQMLLLRQRVLLLVSSGLGWRQGCSFAKHVGVRGFSE